jgi:hypothetical protein
MQLGNDEFESYENNSVTHIPYFRNINWNISGTVFSSALLWLPCIQHQCSKGNPVNDWSFYQLHYVHEVSHFKARTTLDQSWGCQSLSAGWLIWSMQAISNVKYPFVFVWTTSLHLDILQSHNYVNNSFMYYKLKKLFQAFVAEVECVASVSELPIAIIV